MADIFISYASEDRVRIEPLVVQLESAGYSVWWDRHLKGGTRFSTEIESEVRGAAVVLVAWSPNAIKSRWVADEADLALETGNLLPISLDGARSPMGFRQLQTIDFSDWTGGKGPCVSALMEALEHHLKSGRRTPHQAVVLPANSQTKSDASIAVLPFVNMSPDPDQEFFADGISEELLNLLSKIKELTVIARTSSFTFKGSDRSISEIGTILGVAHVLEGSIRKAGNRVRITAQLIETRNSSHLWSETYDRTLEDIFAIQDEISAAIVAELKGLILGGEHIRAHQTERTSDINAYEHYLLGQQLLNKRTRDYITLGKVHFEKALAGDPNYTPALVGLADAHLLLSKTTSTYGTTPIKQALAAAEPLLTKALEQDKTSVEAHGVMSQYSELSGDMDKALGHAQRALALNPNYARGYSLLAATYMVLGDPEAPVLSTIRSAAERDPASLLLLSNLSNQYSFRLAFDPAETVLQQMAAIDPDSPLVAGARAFLKLRNGEIKAALELLLAPGAAFSGGLRNSNTLFYASHLGYANQVEPIESNIAMIGYLAARQLEEARRLGPILAATEGATEDHSTALTLADWHTREGRYDEALALLRPFDESNPDKWGRHFSTGYYYFGATLSLYLHGKLGKKETAKLYLDKLKDIHNVLEHDPDGQPYLTGYIGAIIAATEGDTEAALAALEHQIERTMDGGANLLRAPNFEALSEEPRYQALLAKAKAHYAGERKSAERAGLLPIPAELLARLKSE